MQGATWHGRKTLRDPRQSQRHRDGAANATGLHGPALPRAARASSSIPAAELVRTGTSGPRCRVSAKGVLGPGLGVLLAAVGDSRSHLSPAPRHPRSSLWMLLWQRDFLGTWGGLSAGGSGPGPWGLCPMGPPSPAQQSSGSVMVKPCKSRLGEGEQAGVQEGLQLTGLYR